MVVLGGLLDNKLATKEDVVNIKGALETLVIEIWAVGTRKMYYVKAFKFSKKISPEQLNF